MAPIPALEQRRPTLAVGAALAAANRVGHLIWSTDSRVGVIWWQQNARCPRLLGLTRCQSERGSDAQNGKGFMVPFCCIAEAWPVQ